MNDIKRFDMSQEEECWAEMEERSDGEWVSYEDHTKQPDLFALMAKHNIVVRCLPEFVEENWRHFDGNPLRKGYELKIVEGQPYNIEYKKIIPIHAGKWISMVERGTGSMMSWSIKNGVFDTAEEAIMNIVDKANG